MDKNKRVHFLDDPQLKASQQIYQGAILDLYVNQLDMGEAGGVVEREIIDHRPAACVLAVTNEDKVVLVKQYRPAIVQAIYEIPAGILDPEDATPLVGAKRELEEETDYQAADWKFLHEFYISPGYLNENIYLFEARDLTKVDSPLPQDDDEYVETYEFTRQEAQAMIQAGQIIDLKTLYALEIWLNRKD